MNNPYPMTRPVLKMARPLIALVVVGLFLAFSHAGVHAATARSKYFAAEGCYKKLRNNPAHQKYRDKWLRCINKFLAAHRHDPRGEWASASLFQAGALYVELYKRSFYGADKQEALDIFKRVMRDYPKSFYRSKADRARQALLGQPPKVRKPKTDPAARKAYKRAQADYRRLQQKPELKKYRDQWFRCIQNYHKAYQADPKGPLAAASLYGQAKAYEELYTHSFRASDKEHSRKKYREIIGTFPDSAYAEKARAALGLNAVDTSGWQSDDAIADVIGISEPYQPLQHHSGALATSDNPAIVEGLRFWSNPRYTRVVIDANQDTIFTYRELREDPSIGKPKRIYIDVHKSRLGKNIQKVVPINDNLLRDARAGQYTPDIVRVVVDIKSFKHFKIFSLKNPFRVVLDVWGEDQDTGIISGQPGEADKSGRKIPPSAIVKQLALGVRRIVIDPGHGGKDYGAPGYLKGVHEKKIVLQIGQRLSRMIREQLKCDIILTRTSDKYLSLEERTAIANTQNADLFVSIHTNASPNKHAYGIETFILNLATDDEAIRVAARENATSTKNISDLDSILQDLMKNAKVSESTRLASYVQQSVAKKLKTKYNHVRSKGIKQAPFYVLLGADMPSILIETSFISNPRECKRLTSASYQKRLCQGIVDGIKRYIKETNPMALQPPVTGKVQG